MRLLLIDENEDDCTRIRGLLARFLPPGYFLGWVQDYRAALEMIERGGHDVYLLDYRLGERSGLELIHGLFGGRNRGPLIVLTGGEAPVADVDAVKAAAEECLDKEQLSAALLGHAIRHALERHRMARELTQYREHLEDLVADRSQELSKLNHQLSREIARRKRTEQELRRSIAGMEIELEERTGELRAFNASLEASSKRLRYLTAKLFAAQEEERKRIARELHDSIGSSLGAIKFSLERMLSLAQGSPPPAEPLRRLVDITQQTIDEARRIMSDLRPSLLDDLGAITTINWFIRRFQSIYSHIHVEPAIEVAEKDIPAELGIVIFRIVQEAFHNITKYSRAGFVELSLLKHGGSLELTIADDGTGFDRRRLLSGTDSADGLGLSSMRERTELTGGSFQIESAPGEGTRIRACWNSEDFARAVTATGGGKRPLGETGLRLMDANPEALLPDHIAGIIHELDAHQVQLRMQNEELRQALAEAQAWREKDELFNDLVPLGLVTLDRLGVIRDFNAAASEMLKLQGSRTAPKQLYSFITAGDRELLHLHLKAVFEWQGRGSCTLKLKNPQDTERAVALNSALWRAPNGQRVCLSTVRNIDDDRPIEPGDRETPNPQVPSPDPGRQRTTGPPRTAEQAGGADAAGFDDPDRPQEAASGSYYRELCEASPFGYVTLDRKGVIIQANAAAAKLLGRPTRALVNRFLLQFVHAEDKSVYLFSARMVAQAHSPLPVEVRLTRSDGKLVWVQATAGPWLDAQKRFKGWHVALQDISRRKSTEEALRASERELRQLSAELLTARENERTRIAAELHDRIVQTLAAIKLKIESALRAKATEQPEQGFAHLDGTVALVQNTMQAVQRIYMGLRPTVLDDFGIVSALKWLRRKFLDLYPGTAIEHSIDVREEMIRDDLKLAIYRLAHQGLQNAIVNHWAQDVKLNLTAKDDRLELSIEGRGIGLDVRDAQATGNPYEGVGLASMKFLVEQSGGSFAVESAVGEGAVIRISWPLPADDVQENE